MEADLHAWRRAHPRATWTEIETELDRRLDALRAAVLGEVVADTADAPSACPHCGTRLQRRGDQPRTVLTDGGAAVSLTRSYQTCPACGAGLFPPR